MFKEYVRLFLKLKVESSGYPLNINTVEKKEKWRETYKQKYGIAIDLDNVGFNPGT
jgi:hypothetical protein